MAKAFVDKDGKIYQAFNRFDFEQQIMECWRVTDDIQTVNEYLLDAPLEENREDKIANMLMGIESLYSTRFNKLFRMFEQFNSERYELLNKIKELENASESGIERTREGSLQVGLEEAEGTESQS